MQVRTDMNLAMNVPQASASVTNRSTAQSAFKVEGLRPGSPGVYLSPTAQLCGVHMQSMTKQAYRGS